MQNNTGVNRRQFLARAVELGALLTVPQLVVACSSPEARTVARDAGEATFKDYPIAKAARIAIHAPNPHNSQAWKFRFVAPDEMLLYVDEARLLPDTDPPARQVHMGQGTFLELLRMAAAADGFFADTRLFPEGNYRATDIGKKPVARVKLVPQTGIGVDPLFAFWQQRMTDRTDYRGDILSSAETQKLLELTNPKGCSLRFITQPGQLKTLADSIYEAMSTEMYDQKCADETYKWFRFSDREISEKADGINLRGNGMSGFKLWFVRTFAVSGTKENFQSKSNSEAYLETWRKVADSSRGFALFVTERNGFEDWVKTGYDYMRFQLAVTSMGLAMQPVSQVLQEYRAMEKQRLAFEAAMQVRAPAKIQMLVRLGRSDYRYFAPRRTLDKFVV